MKFARWINLRQVNNLIDWLIILSTSSEMKSMNKRIEFEKFENLFVSLREVNDLIDWNENSSVEFKSIAKISVLNELNSIESAIKIWLINSQSAEKIFLFLCCLNFFLNCFFRFCQVEFFCDRSHNIWNNVYSLKASRCYF